MDCFFCLPTYHGRIVDHFDYFGCSCHFGFFFAMNSSVIFYFLIHFTFSKLWSIVTCMLTKRHDLLSTMYLLAYFFFPAAETSIITPICPSVSLSLLSAQQQQKRGLTFRAGCALKDSCSRFHLRAIGFPHRRRC